MAGAPLRTVDGTILVSGLGIDGTGAYYDQGSAVPPPPAEPAVIAVTGTAGDVVADI
jgi:hypothetical protein